MKEQKKKLLRQIGEIDDKYIEQANPACREKEKKRILTVLSSVAATFAVIVIAAVMVTMLSPRGPYAAVIDRFSAYYHQQNLNNNLSGGNMSGGSGADGGPEMGTSPDDGGGERYEEVTDNQVDGVIEGDLIKRSDRYIYYLNRGKLRIATIAGEESEIVSTLDLWQYFSDISKSGGYRWEMYLSADCKTLTIVSTFIDNSGNSKVGLLALDVSDHTRIVKKGRICVSGSYVSSRLTNGAFLLITDFSPRGRVNYSVESTFLPQVDGVSVPPENIAMPQTLTNTSYTVVCKIDESTLTLLGSAAFLSYSDDVYVTEERVYASFATSEQYQKDGYTISRSLSDLTVLFWGDQFKMGPTARIEGVVKDRYSMDEYEGVLRVVTTTTTSRYRDYDMDGSVSSDMAVGAPSVAPLPDGMNFGTNANLYCIDADTMQLIASCISFAPWGERVTSARFEGTAAYVCTSIQLSDPVFFFDLSDLTAITFKDTGVIEGYSTSLIDFGEYLVGIGILDWTTVKVEVYKETEGGVVSVGKMEIPYASYSTDYKSYYVNRELRLIGFGYTRYWYSDDYSSTDTKSRYVMLLFDGESLVPLADVEINDEDSLKRGLYIDGCLYFFGQNDFKVIPVSIGE